MREVMLHVMRLRFDFGTVDLLKRLLNGRRAADVLDFLRDEFRMRKMGQAKENAAQIVHARFAIDRDVIDFA